MQEAVPVGTGTMAAMLGVEIDILEDICREAAEGEVVSPANFNSPGQIVIAGTVNAVGRAIEIAKARGFRKAMLLPVSAPFHCALMKPAADKLADRLKTVAISVPTVLVIHNVALSVSTTPDAVRSALARQEASPGRGVDASPRGRRGSGARRRPNARRRREPWG